MSKKRLNSKPFKKQTLAEQVANSIKESIVAGDFVGGDALPTEPDISEQFGVSRAVVRDATRMLVAKGLVEAKHGKGVYVTHSQLAAFGDALLLALRRMGASNWDVAEFEQRVLPEVVALAASNATAEDVGAIEAAADAYLTMHAEIAKVGLPAVDSAEYDAFGQTWTNVMQAVFDATHNTVFSLLAQPLIRLHGPRNWVGLPDDITSQETALVQTIISLIKSADAEQARSQMKQLLALPTVAIDALRQTSVSDPTTIDLKGDI